jgi:MoaA/NifB/PqqE/SkfB family radical SAM enzyme
MPKELLDLVRELELRFAEYTNGHWSEDELREKLKNSLTTVNAIFDSHAERVESVKSTSGWWRPGDFVFIQSASSRTGSLTASV